MRNLALLVAAVLLAVLAPAAGAQQQSAPPEQGIGVVGEAESFADNDIGTFRFGVGVRRSTPGAALRGAAVSVRRVIAAVRRSGVAREDIRTDVVRLERVRVRRSQRRVFVARNAIVVVVRRLDAAGSVVDRAVRAGATDVDGPQFGVSDAAEVYRRTLAAAYADARRKAERLAAEAGVALGAPLRIRESGFEEESARFLASGGGEDEQAGSTPVAPGRSRISASVSVTFAIQ